MRLPETYHNALIVLLLLAGALIAGGCVGDRYDLHSYYDVPEGRWNHPGGGR